MVVVGCNRSVGRSAGRERNAQRLLGGGLADAAGDGDHFRGAAPTSGAAEGGQGGERVVDQEKGTLAQPGGSGAGDDGEGGAAVERGRNEIVAVARGAGNGEDVARLEAAAVDRSAGGRRGGSACEDTTGGSLNLLRGPQRRVVHGFDLPRQPPGQRPGR